MDQREMFDSYELQETPHFVWTPFEQSPTKVMTMESASVVLRRLMVNNCLDVRKKS